MSKIISTILLVLSMQLEHGLAQDQHPFVSGIYPHLAVYNEGGECGIGAVVPWGNNLWMVTYSPHFPQGSSDKLYQITSDLRQIIRDESIGGTPANRMIHQESAQLFMGPHAINEDGEVRTISYEVMPGRHTGNARHLKDPANKIFYATMEEGFYEVDVHDLGVRTIFKDGHENGKKIDAVAGQDDPIYAALPGAHGKGLYSGQGVVVYSNNGEASPEALEEFDIESGVLAEWNGEEWKIIRRNQFVEVTGPGGIYGNAASATDPIWATGWDHKSVILGIRSPEKWSFYRLPKASHSYDGAHGWNTEWPRIRNVGTSDSPDYLMTMHGMFWRIPKNLSDASTAGIRPRSAYLKVIGDFTRWNDHLVFACDDSAQKEFLNKRPQKGNIGGPGQSNSNLWFGNFDTPDQLGPTTAHGAVWQNEEVAASATSEPFLFAGWQERSAWISNHGPEDCKITFLIDRQGNGEWQEYSKHEISTSRSQRIAFAENLEGEWIKAQVNKSSTLSLSFNFSNRETRSSLSENIFEGMALMDDEQLLGGLLYGLGDNRRALGIAAQNFAAGQQFDGAYYELDEALNLVRKEDSTTHGLIRQNFQIPKETVEVEESSILVIDAKERRWRLPLGSSAFDIPTKNGQLRICREVATERDLFNCHGTFYELPAENAHGFAKIRPVSSHDLHVHDYASYRGLLVMTGVGIEAKSSEHVIVSDDGAAAVWVGAIDDLWKLGKPVGHGGPWINSKTAAGLPSDPYLIGFYDERRLTLSHNSGAYINITVEVDPTGHGPWTVYQEVTVPPGEQVRHTFPADFEARWIRFTADQDCQATALLDYN